MMNRSLNLKLTNRNILFYFDKGIVIGILLEIFLWFIEVVVLSSILIWKFINYSEKKNITISFCLKWLFNKLMIRYILLVLVIFISAYILLTHFGNKSEVQNGTTQKNIAPSIILILIGTLRGDYLSCYGHPNLMTSNIDRLAIKSTLFTNAYSQAPWTRPSVATLFTSLYPSSHGVIRGSKAKEGSDKLSERALTIAEYIKESGYYTVGFITNPTITADFGFSQGYDEYYFLKKEIINEFSLFDWMARKLHIYLKNRSYVYAEYLIDRAVNWLSKNKEDPFFLYLHFMDPHLPYFHNPGNLLTKTSSDIF